MTEPKVLNIGCGLNKVPGAVNLDRSPAVNPDVVFDLELCGTDPLPFSDDTFDIVLGSHILEHIHNILPLMQELHRVAKPDAKATFAVPYGGNDIAFEDPTHVRFFFLRSFQYFSQAMYGSADYGYRGDWETDSIILKIRPDRVPPNLHAEQVAEMLHAVRNVCEEMVIGLTCVKPTRPPGFDPKQPMVQLKRIEQSRIILSGANL